MPQNGDLYIVALDLNWHIFPRLSYGVALLFFKDIDFRSVFFIEWNGMQFHRVEWYAIP